ncbi:MAG: selenide, water dikinase [Mycobacterium sp.]|nr:selenide, water dikinase [Mycobacterium sp.]
MTTTATARRLTQYSNGGGCACKLPQSMLSQLLTTVGGRGVTGAGPDLLVGLEFPDDAAVYAIDDTRAWIVTTDFLTPVVDDPFTWGRIAATNALSDVYAMGGRPLLTLNILAWPTDLGDDVLAGVLDGGAAAIAAAGAVLVGGHSIVDPIPKYGLVAIGEVDRDHILIKGGGRPGDQLILTKPIGVGVVSTAVKRGQATPAAVDAAAASMTRLNACAAQVARAVGLRGGTDVTGYGLIGHLHEMAAAAGLEARIDADAVPLLPEVADLIADGCAPDGTRRTLANALAQNWFEPGVLAQERQLLLADAQTSGGLLLACPPAQADTVLAALHDGGDFAAARVGEFLDTGRAGVISIQEGSR